MDLRFRKLSKKNVSPLFLLNEDTLDRADPLGQNGPHRRVRVFLALNLYKTTCVMAMSLGLFLVPTQLLSARKGTAMITCGSNKMGPEDESFDTLIRKMSLAT